MGCAVGVCLQRNETYQRRVNFRFVRLMMRTLYNLSDLRQSRFGQPPPRHGLNLLWWFARKCVYIDSNSRMIAKFNPANGAFGFHQFYNVDGLLPYSNLPYYEVGNLNTTDSLPEYVTEDDTGYSDDDSNTDRIIVLFNSSRSTLRFDRIYVTQHSDQVNFDRNHTYCININLMKVIKRLSRKKFLLKTLNDSYQITIEQHCRRSQFPSAAQSVEREHYQSQRSHSSFKDVCAKCCNLLMCAIVLLLIIVLFSKMKI